MEQTPWIRSNWWPAINAVKDQLPNVKFSKLWHLVKALTGQCDLSTNKCKTWKTDNMHNSKLCMCQSQGSKSRGCSNPQVPREDGCGHWPRLNTLSCLWSSGVHSVSQQRSWKEWMLVVLEDELRGQGWDLILWSCCGYEGWKAFWKTLKTKKHQQNQERETLKPCLTKKRPVPLDEDTETNES